MAMGKRTGYVGWMLLSTICVAALCVWAVFGLVDCFAQFHRKYAWVRYINMAIAPFAVLSSYFTTVAFLMRSTNAVYFTWMTAAGFIEDAFFMFLLSGEIVVTAGKV
ncbi:hypothetical protein Tcan_13177 [Toxocara canis]|uniref:Uncharacterized protein n=1 Tax=Toxocara canis TaxID=6265 RepID=A0A0B2VSE0_TOXCA|nr:hypothetical protein Tcan_13177 [Toxocara canis]